MNKHLTKQLCLAAILLSLVLNSAWCQTFSVASGASSVDITITSPIEGRFYYLLYNVKPSSEPTATQMRAPATSNLVKSGSGYISTANVGLELKRTLVNIKDNATYYLYLMFDPAKGNTSSVSSYTLVLPRRQPSFFFNSSALAKIANNTNVKLSYLLYKPEGYLKDKEQKKYPLIVSFHGDPQSSDVNAVRNTGLPAYLDAGNDVDCIVVSPLASFFPGRWFAPGLIDELVEKMKKEERIDETKIYVTGLSGGGGGVHYYAAEHPEKVAAVVPVCCVNVFWGSDFISQNNYCPVKNIPYWFFHNQYDNVVTVNNSNAVINGILSCSPKPAIEPLKTFYPVGGHDAWTTTYRNTKVYKWMLGYTKPNPLNKQPVILTDSIVNVRSYSAEIKIKATATDPDATGSLTYEWYLLKGSDITLQDMNSSTLSLSGYSLGTYTFRLLVTDGKGSRNFKDFTVSISGFSIPTDLQEVPVDNTKGFLYPNPSSDKINFNTSSSEDLSFRIFDLSGKPILEGKSSDGIDVSRLPKGLYTVETSYGIHKFNKL